MTTKDRILDAAEALFAERGFEGTSLRAVTGDADVNLAAVSYHFGGKVQLFQAVIARRVEDVNQERLARLGQAESAAAGAPVALEILLEAFLGPPIRMAARGEEGMADFMRIVGRLNASSGEHLEAVHAVFAEVFERFSLALGRTLPHLGPTDLLWRFHFMLGSFCLYVADPGRLRLFSAGRCRSDDAEEALRQLIAFAAGAFAAPLPAPAVHADESETP